MLIVADRLKISLSDVLNMELWEYNHWIAYLLIEQDEHKEAIRKAKHR
jgi:hypothetical protein